MKDDKMFGLAWIGSCTEKNVNSFMEMLCLKRFSVGKIKHTATYVYLELRDRSQWSLSVDCI